MRRKSHHSQSLDASSSALTPLDTLPVRMMTKQERLTCFQFNLDRQLIRWLITRESITLIPFLSFDVDLLTGESRVKPVQEEEDVTGGKTPRLDSNEEPFQRQDCNSGLHQISQKKVGLHHGFNDQVLGSRTVHKDIEIWK